MLSTTSRSTQFIDNISFSTVNHPSLLSASSCVYLPPRNRWRAHRFDSLPFFFFSYNLFSFLFILTRRSTIFNRRGSTRSPSSCWRERILDGFQQCESCSTVAAAFLIPRFYTTLSRFFNRERILRERFQRPASRMHYRRSNSSREPFFRVASRARSSPLQASSYDSILVIDISRHIPLRQLSFTRFIDEDLSRP